MLRRKGKTQFLKSAKENCAFYYLKRIVLQQLMLRTQVFTKFFFNAQRMQAQLFKIKSLIL
jgi:hypothetical protein